MKKGLFIVVDGPSSSGKDSIVKQVKKDLSKLGLKAISIEETKEANYDRKKILKAKQKGNKEAAKTIINERKKLYLEKVVPQLSIGKVVIANRGEPSTLSYQTLNEELAIKDAWNMHRIENIPLPNLVVITNCSVKEAVRREHLRKPSSEEKDERFMSGKFTMSSKEENLDRRTQIHEAYEKVKNFLEDKGLPVIYLNTDNMNVSEESKSIVSFMRKKLLYE